MVPSIIDVSSKTFGQSTGIAEEQFFDVEIYHADPDIVEQVADAFAGRDGYRGEFGVGIVQGFFVDSQADDYVPGIEFTDADNVHSAFIQVEVRQFAAP